ncbi:MAG: hypothetical protein KatS3mg087_1521 [Patescibacteria group bacterium]|nr:MAG: hypothetical protein KatS3mg087_1521 [Patescibacteria group bacterium]
MRITITVPCGNNKHPITLDISNWNKWVIADSPCIQQYGKLFGSMMPCAEYIQKRNIALEESLLSLLRRKQYRNQQTLQTLQHILETTHIASTLKKAIEIVAFFKKDGLPILAKIITNDINIHAEIYAAEAIIKMSKNKNISIPRKLKIISHIIHLRYYPNPIKLKEYLNIVVKEKIFEAVHAIIRHIENRGASNTICIDAILRLGTPDLETIKQYLHQDKTYLREAAILILEQAEPPDLMEIAFDAVFNADMSSAIASRIIQNKATREHHDKIIHILKQDRPEIPISRAIKTLTNIYGIEAKPILIQELRNNPNMSNWKKEKIYTAIIQIDQEHYKTHPIQILIDLQPRKEEIDLLIETLTYSIEIDTSTRNTIRDAIIQHLKENPIPEHDPDTIAKILSKFGKIY